MPLKWKSTRYKKALLKLKQKKPEEMNMGMKVPETCKFLSKDLEEMEEI